MDARAATLEHIEDVRSIMEWMTTKLAERASVHDASKLEEPELSAFQRLADFKEANKDIEYNSPQYKDALRQLGPALTHHYDANDHHPAHFRNGVNGMTLLSLCEMLADWAAASKRYKGGSAVSSMEINKQRFSLSDQLSGILLNTILEMISDGVINA